LVDKPWKTQTLASEKKKKQRNLKQALAPVPGIQTLESTNKALQDTNRSLGKLTLEYADLFLISRKMRLTELTGHAPILGHIKTLENADLYLRSRKARVTELTGHAPSLGHITLENADLSFD
jgi:hypothetical protein